MPVGPVATWPTSWRAAETSIGLCQAVALIDENLRSKAFSTDDKRAKVKFLIADPRKEKIGEAIQAMEDLVKDTDATPDDYFSLAQLYLRKGDWNNYENRMHSVLGAQKGTVQPAHVVFYINRSWRRRNSTRRQLATDLGENAPPTISTRCG